MASSIGYAPIDIDIMDDPKVAVFLDDEAGDDGAARLLAFGRLVTVLQSVYRSGFYMRYGRLERRKLAKDLALPPDGLDAFMGRCVDCEIFDAAMLERGVVTSHGIQERYFRAKGKGKLAVRLTDEEQGYLLDRTSAGDGAEPRGEARVGAEPRGGARTGAESRDKRREEKEREEKGREEEEARAAARGSSSSSSDQIPSIASGGGRPLAQPYPLACLSAVADPAAEYYDDEGAAFETPWDALVSTYDHRTRGQPIGPFAAQVARLCPAGCPRDLESVERCARLLQRALARYDPAVSGSPFPLARRIIEDERGDAA